jgi:hypothetical protein
MLKTRPSLGPTDQPVPTEEQTPVWYWKVPTDAEVEVPEYPFA